MNSSRFGDWVPITVSERGLLEKIIDDEIRDLPTITKAFRQTRNQFMLKEEIDFALGFAVGEITMKFAAAFLILKNVTPAVEDMVEVMTITARRSRELREAILKAG
jgi:hypothetical protein